MDSASAAVRVVAALGLMLLVAAVVYAVSNGRFFLFPFLLLIGFPMAAVFRARRPPPPDSSEALPPPPRISLN